MPQNNIIKIKTYKRKSALNFLISACKIGWTGKLDNIIDFTWHKEKKDIKEFENTKLGKIITNIMFYIFWFLLICVIYQIINLYIL